MRRPTLSAASDARFRKNQGKFVAPIARGRIDSAAV